MADRFNPGRAKKYFSPKFLKHHVYVGSAGAKKRAEEVFQRRGKAVSTVLCLTMRELVQLAGEIHAQQETFGRSPRKLFKTERAYDYWSRGGSQSKEKQRATLHTSRFAYGVKWQGEIYVMAHLEA
jgi:hypothetical protein